MTKKAREVLGSALARRLSAAGNEYNPEYGFRISELAASPKPGDTWDWTDPIGNAYRFKMLEGGMMEVWTDPPIEYAKHITQEIGFTNPDPVPPAQLALYEHMAYLSSEHWCAGWMDRLGEKLQGIIDRDNHHPAGYVAFTVEEFEKLKHLHAEAGGWWVWDDAVVDGPEGDCVRFVPDATSRTKP